MTDVSFRIGFIGLGLIGGSIAKAIKRVYPNYFIIAFDTDKSSLSDAYNHKVIDMVCNSVDSNFEELDIIFLCSPVRFNLMYLDKLKKIIKSTCILTDVGSVKGDIHEGAIEYNLEDNYIGGHPMAGSERIGYCNSNDRLLENAYYMITPTSRSTQSNIDKLVKIIGDIGAIPLVIDYTKHDYITASISHLPHIIASGLVNLIKDSDDNEYMKLLAAGGFKDITRIASSSPTMWQHICLSNANFIKLMLDNYIKSLNKVSDAIREGKEDYLYNFFDCAKDYRESIPDSSTGVISKIYQIFVDIVDESGAIATIATLLSDNNISIKNIGIIHNREFYDGVLRIEFYDEVSMVSGIGVLKEYSYMVYNRK